MYSAVVFGCPKTTINPSRVISRPTLIILVAIAMSTDSLSVIGRSSRRFASATSLVSTRLVSSTTSLFRSRLSNRPCASPTLLRSPCRSFKPHRHRQRAFPEHIGRSCDDTGLGRRVIGQIKVIVDHAAGGEGGRARQCDIRAADCIDRKSV